MPVGDLRAEPRRADARQAHRQGAWRGVRGVRSRARHADLWPRAPARLPPMLDGSRAASGWPTACCSPSPAHPCSSTARRSAWARSCPPRGAMPCARPCSGGRPQRRVLRRPPLEAPGARGAGGFGPEHVNVEAQRRDEDSLLTFIGRLIRRYREAPSWDGGAGDPRPAGAVSARPHCATRRGHDPGGPQPLGRAAHRDLRIGDTVPGTRLVDQLCDESSLWTTAGEWSSTSTATGTTGSGSAPRRSAPRLRSSSCALRGHSRPPPANEYIELP